MQKIINKLLFLGILACAIALVVVSKQSYPVEGSVTVGNDYTATTTSTITPALGRWLLTATSSTDSSSHTGTFGGFVQTAAGTAGGNINIYDATTTNASQRWPQATSSILLGSLPANATVGTYTFDAEYKRGLLIVTDGTVGTTTILYR